MEKTCEELERELNLKFPYKIEEVPKNYVMGTIQFSDLEKATKYFSEHDNGNFAMYRYDEDLDDFDFIKGKWE